MGVHDVERKVIPFFPREVTYAELSVQALKTQVEAHTEAETLQELTVFARGLYEAPVGVAEKYANLDDVRKIQTNVKTFYEGYFATDNGRASGDILLRTSSRYI